MKIAAATVVAAAGILAVPSGEWWNFPSAYQYWSITTVLGVVVLASLVGDTWKAEGWRWARRGGVIVLLGAALVPLADTPRFITRPPPTAASELVNSARNRLVPRPGYPDHEVFLVYRRALSARGRAALAQGYGASLVDAERLPPGGGPPALLERLDPDEGRALLGGAGCRAAELKRPVDPSLGPDFAGELCSRPGVPALGSPLPPRHSGAALYRFVGGAGSVWRRR